MSRRHADTIPPPVAADTCARCGRGFQGGAFVAVDDGAGRRVHRTCATADRSPPAFDLGGEG